jgi:hypothetical protein
MATNLIGLKSFGVFSVAVQEEQLVSEKSAQILELKTAIQAEIATISNETLNRILNNFVLRLRKVHDPQGHCVKYV